MFRNARLISVLHAFCQPRTFRMIKIFFTDATRYDYLTQKFNYDYADSSNACCNICPVSHYGTNRKSDSDII